MLSPAGEGSSQGLDRSGRPLGAPTPEETCAALTEDADNSCGVEGWGRMRSAYLGALDAEGHLAEGPLGGNCQDRVGRREKGREGGDSSTCQQRPLGFEAPRSGAKAWGSGLRPRGSGSGNLSTGAAASRNLASKRAGKREGATTILAPGDQA